MKSDSTCRTILPRLDEGRGIKYKNYLRLLGYKKPLNICLLSEDSLALTSKYNLSLGQRIYVPPLGRFYYKY